MQIPFFTLDRQHLALKTELENVYARVIEKGRFVLGDEVTEFERNLAHYTGVSNCVTCGNGTDALELILQGLGIEQGMEVIVPANTWMSVAEAVINVGGIPRLADVDASTLNLNFDKVEGLISQKTFAVIAVHQFGHPVDLLRTPEKLRSHGIYIIEDCAHATGAIKGDKMCGAMGDAASFSFYPTKNLGCLGDGGAITTNDSKLADKIRSLRNHGQIQRDHHIMRGRNSRLDELQAGFLNLKLKHLTEWNNKRKSNAKFYYDHIKNNHVECIKLDESVFHQFVLLTDKRDQLKEYLQDNGISTQIHYPQSLSELNLFDSIDPTPVSNALSRKLLSIPIFPELTKEELNYIVRSINEFLPV